MHSIMYFVNIIFNLEMCKSSFFSNYTVVLVNGVGRRGVSFCPLNVFGK